MTRKKKLMNRELSWLSFNHRVLQEAQDKNVPLVERLRFLGIFSNNLDEFFKVRVATIKRMLDIQQGSQRVEGIKPQKLMAKIQRKVLNLQNQFETTYHNLVRELEKHHIFMINENGLNEEQETFVRIYFKEMVRPEISPIMLKNLEGRFPYLKDKSIYLAIKLTKSITPNETEYAVVEIPTHNLPRFIELPSRGESKFIILLEDVIRYSLPDIFAIFKFDIFEAWTIKLTRDAELDMDNDLSQSFLETISKGVSGRKTGQPVRFVFDSGIAKDLLDYLIEHLGLEEDNNLIAGGRYHNFKDFMKFPNIGGQELEFDEMPPLPHPDITPGLSILEVMKQKDFLLHVPYQDFNIFISLLQEASIDPMVTEMSLTIYRAAQNSKVVNALINACQNGKKVNVIVELQARFDEELNIHWSRMLEEAGANVYFGIQNLKVHAKLLCISRREGKKTENYACVSTGNFHEGNATVYTDLILFTSDNRIAGEVKKVFEFFEHIYRNQTYRHLVVSPLFMRRKFYRLIDNEIRNAKSGKNAYIILRINNLVDKDIINKLYDANAAGVKLKLVIRGICSLLPGVEGFSENIQATSVVDRYLEHARVIVFGNNGDEQYFILSADWMTRNLDRRIEVACPIYDKKLQKELSEVLEIQLSDNVKARAIDYTQDNKYVEQHKKAKVRSQYKLYNYYKEKLKQQYYGPPSQ